VRRRGLGKPVAPLMLAEIEQLAHLKKRKQGQAPPWQYPLRWVLRSWLRSVKADSSALVAREPV
jgi:hypothetical protein